MNNESNKQLIGKLITAQKEIEQNRTGKASYISLSEEWIQKQADENNISFAEMVKVIENELNPKQNENE
jgi:hypothetical protein